MEDSNLDSYQIKKGLSESQVEQLINYAATDEGLNFTSDKTRFKDRQSFDKFSKEILVYYALTNENDDLLGIIWFHNLPIPVIASEARQSQTGTDSSPAALNDKEYGISFAIRLYGEARGKGLAQPFTEEVMVDFKQSEEYKTHPHKKIWLSVSPENEPAVKLYRKLGFKELELNEELHKLLMVLGK